MVTINQLSHQEQYGKPWFYFDADFYIAQCVEKGVSPSLGTPDFLLQHYLKRGARIGLSPNFVFDEEYYRLKYPAVVRELQLGTFSSGFDHFLNIGAERDFTPTWFFDGIHYRNLNPDLSDENLRSGNFSDRYGHYLAVGIGERRIAHWTVEFLKKFTGEVSFPSDLAALRDLVIGDEQLPKLYSPLFDQAWMSEKYQWGRAVPPRRFMRHYLLNVGSDHLSPSPYFDEAFYLANEPRVQAAIKDGSFVSGYQHFLTQGMNEWRRPFAGFDPDYYFRTNMLAEEGDNGAPLSQSPFQHFLKHRKTRSLPISPPLALRDLPEDVGKGIYERRCALNAQRLADIAFPVDHGTVPAVSILIIARNNFEQTANCIVSAAYATKAAIEVVVFDNGSSDDVSKIPSINPGIKYLRSERNLGFTTAVNAAAKSATGRALLLLNNDAEVTAGAIDRALDTLEADPTIGAVGAKIVRMHGKLQEAGSIIWSDGSCLGYGRDADPLDGQVDFVRDVDFCSGCFLAIRRSDWEELNGFDEAYAPAYYEETDLCARIWERGQRVVYDPRIVVWHFEFGSSSVREEPLALMRRNQRYFVSQHAKFLAGCLQPATANIERARLRHTKTPRVLFIEDQLPDPTIGMGFTRSATVARALGQSSGLVSIVGLHAGRRPRAGFFDNNIEIVSNVGIETIGGFFSERAGVYDVIWLSRTHNLVHLKRWREAHPAFFNGVRIVLDTEAIAALRRFTYAEQAKRPADLDELVLQELEYLDGIDHICVVSPLDRDIVQKMLAQRGLNIPVSVLGHSLQATTHQPTFSKTRDIVLAGSYSQPDGPNADGLLWFDRDVRPLLPNVSGLRFVIAGHDAKRFVASGGLKHDYEIIDSPPDMADVYRSARLMIAPTRFAAGLPMKVHEAASHGVPVVMTELLGRQLGWLGKHVSAVPADPAAMAQAIEALVSDPKTWRNVQERQLELLAADCDPDRFEGAIREIVGVYYTEKSCDLLIPIGEPIT